MSSSATRLTFADDGVDLADQPFGTPERRIGDAHRRAQGFELGFELGAPRRDFFRFRARFRWRPERIELLFQCRDPALVGAAGGGEIRPEEHDLGAQRLPVIDRNVLGVVDLRLCGTRDIRPDRILVLPRRA